METKTTFLKSCLLALFLLISSTAFSATYYVCSGATLNFAPTPITDITYSWDVKQAGTSITGYPRAAAPTSLPAAGIYEVLLISTYTGSDPTVCAPEVGTNTIIVLPTLSITTDPPTKTTYCGTATASSSVITVTSTTPTLPADVAAPLAAPYSADLEYEYSYSVVKTVGAVVSAAVDGVTSGLGTVDATTKIFTLTTDDVGSYAITATLKYKRKTGAVTVTGTLLGNGCPATSTRTVVVTAPPSAPSITVTAP